MVDISVIADVLVALGTFSLAFLTYMIVRENRIEKEGKQKAELIRKIVLPNLDQLERQIPNLKNKQIAYQHMSKITVNVGKLFIPEDRVLYYDPDFIDRKTLFNEFKDKYSHLFERIKRHNELHSNLASEAQNLFILIDKQNFKNEVQNLLSQWNISNKFRITIHFDDYVYYDVIKWVMDNSVEENTVEQRRDFWDTNSKQLLKIRDENSISKQITIVEQIIEELLKISIEIQSELKKIREDFRGKYKYSLEELRPRPVQYVRQI